MEKIQDLITNGRTIIFVGTKVYDVTTFSNHPGGKKCLQNKIGQDCSNDMRFHSKSARKYMEQFLVAVPPVRNCCMIM